ncbi:MAG: NAD(P)/FAD-dependent oxidoreductase [Candidatus Zixiibacteriota bacterium]|nr:MAG: NAD(P)/FAD-dependent oxidoreductase [candidate division Zixibacteria bacterium]
MRRSDQKHRVVIIGGGFGGLYAAKLLDGAPVDVTLIDRRNFHLFQPLLYQVATGGLSPADISSPLRAILKRHKNIRTLMGAVTDIDTVSRKVVFENDRIPYDTLIVATGADNHYFGNNHWRQYAPGLKTIEDALDIRHRILFAFEAAERESDPQARRGWLNFVVIGGGPTGVELAGALAEIAYQTVKDDFRRSDPRQTSITLVEGTERLLGTYPGSLSSSAEKQLKKLGVRVILNARVTDINSSGIEMTRHGRSETLNARTILWAAGVKTSSLSQALTKGQPELLDSSGRVVVNSHLNIAGHKEIFVVGDLANFSYQTGEPLSGLAPVAMQQGKYAARLIKARLKGKNLAPFRYTDLGNLATIGRSAAVGYFGKLKFSGLPAWLIWLFVHLMYLAEFENRLLVLIQWAWNYFTRNRGARLITGETPSTSKQPSEPEKVEQ